MAKKLALCAGLNYPGTDAALSGCINDMNDWAAQLRARGYEVVTLAEPGKAELVDQLEDMVSKGRTGDKVVFTYSGHGTWLPDKDGDEADQRDEALVCTDYKTGGLLLDDEIQNIFGAARFGVRRLIISDSCHSGTMSRFVGAVAHNREPARARFMPPAQFLEEDSPLWKAALQVEAAKANSTSRRGTVLLSGCCDSEFSYDATFNGRPNGAMTHFAIKALESGASTVRAVHKHIRKTLPSTDYPQTPQLTALPHQGRWSFL